MTGGRIGYIACMDEVCIISMTIKLLLLLGEELDKCISTMKRDGKKKHPAKKESFNRHIIIKTIRKVVSTQIPEPSTTSLMKHNKIAPKILASRETKKWRFSFYFSNILKPRPC